MQAEAASWVSSNRCLFEYWDDDDDNLVSLFKDGFDSLLVADAEYAKKTAYPSTKESTQEAIDYLHKKLQAAIEDEYSM